MIPTIELQDVTIKDTIASARVNISYHEDGKSFDSFGTLTYVITDTEYVNAPVEDVTSVLRGFVMAMLNNII